MRVPAATDAAPRPRGHYSQAIVTEGRLLYTSGQEPIDPRTDRPVGGSMRQQTQRALQNLRAVVEAAGGQLSDAVKVTAYIADLAAFDEYDRAFAEFFDGDPPARTTIRCELPGFAVEIEAVVALGPSSPRGSGA